MLDLDEIQGDVVVGLQKDVENFVFFKIANGYSFKQITKLHGINHITTAELALEREQRIARRQGTAQDGRERYIGTNLGFTKNGLNRLIGSARPKLDAAFERGADDPETVATLNDSPKSRWLAKFTADRIDGVLLVTGPDRPSVRSHSDVLLRSLGHSITVVYSEMANVRPGPQRGHEHFGFLDGVSQPGIRGLTQPSDPKHRPNQGLPGQDLLWPGEFVFGYPSQDPSDPVKPGPSPDMAASWMRNGSFMVFRRLEQKVPEFRKFVADRAARLGMDRELLAARLVGRWRSGAPLELSPLRDNPGLGGDDMRNNDFEYGDDPFQRRCPYAAHIRKSYPRDDSGNEAEAERHRIIRAGIPFGPEVEPGEVTTRHSRGLMFVCYQTSIERQFEFVQRSYANNPDFVGGKTRTGGGAVTPGFDPIIGQAPGDGARKMDEPFPNFPAGSRRTALELPNQFVVLTAAGYFFMPSISALRTELT